MFTWSYCIRVFVWINVFTQCRASDLLNARDVYSLFLHVLDHPANKAGCACACIVLHSVLRACILYTYTFILHIHERATLRVKSRATDSNADRADFPARVLLHVYWLGVVSDVSNRYHNLTRLISAYPLLPPDPIRRGLRKRAVLVGSVGWRASFFCFSSNFVYISSVLYKSQHGPITRDRGTRLHHTCWVRCGTRVFALGCVFCGKSNC